MVQQQASKIMMTPQLQQAIKLLQLSTPELLEAVQQELDENPVLEFAGNEWGAYNGTAIHQFVERAEAAKIMTPCITPHGMMFR